MNTSPAKSKDKNQEWPYITWAEAEGKWKVDARTKDGGSRRFFESKVDARTFAQQCRAQRDSNGTSAFGNVELASFGKSMQQAVEFYVAHLRQQAKSVPIEQAIQELLAARRSAGRSESYCRDMQWRLNRFARDNAGALLASFDVRGLDQWLTGLNLAPGARNTYRRDLQTLFSFGEKHGYCENVAAKTEIATAVDKPAGILSVLQAASLLAACGNDMLPYVAIGLFAGLRAAEMKKLDWSEVDFEGGHILVTAAKSKTRRRRLVPIHANLAAWLRPLVQLSGPVAPVGIRKRFEAVRRAARLAEWPNNALRHSFGSYRLAECQDAPRVSLEMGNSPQMVFAHYRELVRPKDAERFWSLLPEAATSDSNVALAEA